MNSKYVMPITVCHNLGFAHAVLTVTGPFEIVKIETHWETNKQTNKQTKKKTITCAVKSRETRPARQENLEHVKNGGKNGAYDTATRPRRLFPFS